MTTEDVMARMRDAIGRHRCETPVPDEQILDCADVRGAIVAAQAGAQVGTKVTPMAQIPFPLRRLAQLTGGLVLKLASFITFEQRSFNIHVLHALSLVADKMDRLIVSLGPGFVQRLEAGMEARLEAVVRDLSGRNSILSTTVARQEKTINDLLSQQQKTLNELASLKTSLVLQERRVSMLLEEAAIRLPASFDREQVQAIANEERHDLDGFYVAFEDRFRGSRQEIMHKLGVYLPYIRQAVERTAGAVVLDVGCGRGEWLELLYREGIPARGVDTNRLMIEQCRARCLEVVNGDALTYLRSLPDGELGAVTGFHVIEHLPFEELIRLMDETIRVLRPGGIVIFETPNPQNLAVGGCSFYMDPTHQRPLPSTTIRLLAELRGFVDVDILDLHPSTATPINEQTDVAARFNELFYGPMDYAVLGRKAQGS